MHYMIVVKDAMVLIYLAKITLLEKSCEYLENVIIPPAVFDETVTAGKKADLPDAFIIEKAIQNKKILVKNIEDKSLLSFSYSFNIYGGEAEALALYKQEKADYLISDDDNVRRKKEVIQANVIGSLAVLLKLREINMINKYKFVSAIDKLREVGWFSSALLDKVLLEGEKYE